MKKKVAVVPAERVAARIFVIRGQSVMFDSDLAGIYGVETRVLPGGQTQRRALPQRVHVPAFEGGV